ncbi:MAG: restriction endonuclease subunit S [Idiomarina sp.]|uniref:restriction endonuclease subunit S n=1 Tax=Idiomarina sp. TaxID=1874361 RepID=UPI000C54B3FC|nr:restriction endonuclease subunit S [Idiomarina sp.]MBT41589.1 restriction endonuclease subunit S [Idiomarina sp.]
MEVDLMRLADCCTIKPPKSEARKKLSSNDWVSFVPMANLGTITPKIELTSTRKFSEVSGSYTYFSDGDVLLAKITPCFENGKLGIADGLENGVGFGSSEFVVLRPQSFLDPKYLYYFLSQPGFRKAGERVMSGAVGHKRVPKEFIEDTKLPVPSLDEQKRIVTTLDEAFADIDKVRALTQRNLENARKLFESSLQEVFSCKSEGWELRPLDSLSSIINGYAFKSGEFSSSNELRAIKITNVGVYNFIEDSKSYLPSEFSEKYHRYKAYAGDVIVALTRTIISGGLKVAVVPNSYNGALVNQRVAAVRVNENVMPKELLQAFMSTKTAIKYVKSNVNELMQPNLSIKDLKQFPIPVPPKEEVRTVLSQVNAIRDAKQSLTSIYASKLELLEELKKSLLQKAFTGELTKAA